MRVTGTGAAAAAFAALLTAGITALGTVTPAAASTAARQLAPVTISHPGGHLPGFLRARKALVLQAGQQPACPAPARPGLMQCMSIHPKRALGTRPAGNPGGLAPADLRAAYSIRQAAARNGKGRTVAIVDAFSDPNAAKDLAAYRSQFHLPACGTAGGCLKIVNEWGNSKSLPKSNAGWGFEESLDLDMVSAICPNCHIVLLEARSAAVPDLGTAVNTAVAQGIKIISNSWNSGGEFTGEQAYNKYFNHPGVAITVAAGDFGYGTAYPADTQFVTAVGGTALRRASNARGWTENAWIGGGSGCSTLEAKPSWQSADATAGTGCLNRTENDVSAVASPNTAVAVRDSFNDGPSWTQAGGTSVATPVIAGIYALAGNPAAGTYPAEYPYRSPGSFYDVTAGSNGSCESNRQYLCNGETGYDGPTGLGTPNGTGGFAGSGSLVALVDPGTQDAAAGGAFALKITGLDGNTGGSLSYGATGLTAAGLSIAPLSGSTNAQITGTLAGTPGTFPVTVTATDPKTGRSGAVSFRIVTVASLTAGTAAAGPLRFAGGTGCLDGGAGTPATKVLNQACSSATGQKWTFAAAASPGAAGGELQLSPTVCLGESGGAAVLAGCGANGTFWLYPGLGELVNRLNGGCLALPKVATGQRAATATCTGGPTQQWELTTATITSGVSGLCLAAGTSPPVAVDTCATVTGQQWRTGPAGSLISSSGNCLSMGGNPPGDMLDGTQAILASCESAANGNNIDQIWVPGPGGELINALSGKCLADPSAGGAGTSLAQQDCYGSADEIWAIN